MDRMDRPGLERRKEPRAAGEHLARVDLPLLLDVEVLDVSASGLLFTSPEPLRIGQHAKLRTVFGDVPFSATVEIRRCVRSRDTQHGFYVGARFAGLDEAMHRTVSRFLSQVEHPR